MRDELDKKINAILDCPGCDERDQRIAELEAEKSELIKLDSMRAYLLKARTADNTRLREALEKTKASLVKYLRNTDALIYTEAGDFVLKIQQALAPQPEKEGE